MMDFQNKNIITALENSKKDKRLVIEWLSESFPAAFFKKASQVKPLKLGILEDIFGFYDCLEAPPFSKRAIREALNYYSGSKVYLNCQKIESPRIDLYGNEVDVVTDEQAKYAHGKYQTRYGTKPK